MAIKRVKPTSPGRRFQTYATFEEITKKAPEKALLGKIKKNRRPQRQRTHHQPSPRRGAQALLPHYRL
jgi:ribosomal protein L2